MSETTGRRRAPSMTIAQRREMIVQAVLPLIAEHGAAVTTRQLAQAAGIGEGTIFRAFADKDELLAACVVAALQPDSTLDAIAAIPRDLPLADRLVEAAAELEAHLGRIGRLLGAGLRVGPEHRPAPPTDRARSFADTAAAVAALFDPAADGLRREPAELAAVFVTLVFARARGGTALGGEPAALADLVDVFLHGALDRHATRAGAPGPVDPTGEAAPR